MATKQKTHSVKQAAAATGYHEQTLYHQCQAGKLGRKILIPQTGTHIYRISEKEILMLNMRKTLSIKQSGKQS